MATYTKYKSLEKPLSTEKYNVAVANKNNDVIDSELHKLDLKNQNQDELLATKESLNFEITRATTKENDIIEDLASEIARAKLAESSNADDISNEATRALTAEENISTTLQNHISDKSNPHNTTKEQIELGNVDNTSDMDKPVSTAQQNALDSAVSTHDTSDSSHNDIRLLIQGLTTRLNTLADSDDTTLDQLSEIVAYIKNNKSLIDGITTSKVNISDIIDDLTTNSGDKVLSAKQGTILKGLITDLTEIVGNKVDKISGKGLSTNDYTTSDKNKLGGISSGAEVNVQSDWNVTDSTSDAFIKNKPTSMKASNIIFGLSGFSSKKISDIYIALPSNSIWYYATGNETDQIFTNNTDFANIVKKYCSCCGVIKIEKIDLSRSHIEYTQGLSGGTIPTKLLIGISSTGIINSNNVIVVSNDSSSSSSTGITYSDSQPTTLSAGMTWIGT